MNAPKTSSLITETSEEATGLTALQGFQVDKLELLAPTDLLLAQSLVGQGNTWGFWETPESIAPGHLANIFRRIDLAKRLRQYLSKEAVVITPCDSLIAEGVLALTRIALLIRLVPTGGRHGAKTMRPKPSSIAQYMYQSWPKIIARAILRKSENPNATGLISCLTEVDLREFGNYKQTRIELERLQTLACLGLWSDAPILPDISVTTDPSGAAETHLPQVKPVPHMPLSDEWMADIGPRVLWVIREFGPNLLRSLEALAIFLETVDWSLSATAISNRIADFVEDHLRMHPWRDRQGQPLKPSFPLVTASANKSGFKVDEYEWPPRTYMHLKILSQTLQSSHIFITLLVSAGRVGEVAKLKRDCIATARDAKHYLGGWTYKLSGNLFGDAREWPAPDVLLECLGQQARLAEIWDRIPRVIHEGIQDELRDETLLWVPLGTGGKAAKGEGPVDIHSALIALAKRLGVDPKPGGKNVHPHRFRKTIGRLAGVALFNSPLVLKRLFGHKSIEMTLHYILCDPDIRSEAERVLRELRIMHCADALEEIHDAMAAGIPMPGNGGPGASRLLQAVAVEQERLESTGRVWDKGSAHDLAFLLTANGSGWRLIQENIVCAKNPGENGLCQQKRNRGEPNTSNCKPECDNRIVLVRHRRDVEAMARQYLNIASQAKEDGQILVLAHAMENLRTEIDAFADLKERFVADPDFQSLEVYCEDVGV